jgi:hypothetical protein
VDRFAGLADRRRLALVRQVRELLEADPTLRRFAEERQPMPPGPRSV